MRHCNRIQAHRVVQACLDIAGAVRGCPVIIRYPYGDRLDAALEVRTDRCAEHTEFIFLGRFDPDDTVRADHKRSDIQGCARAVRRHIVRVGLHQHPHCLQKLFFRKHRHDQPLAAGTHAGRIQIRPETDDPAVNCPVCLEAFKAGLGILEDAGTFTQCNGRVCLQAAFFPLSAAVPAHISVIGLNVAEAKFFPVNFLFHINLLMQFHHT